MSSISGLPPDDAVVAAPVHHRVLFENDAVRVLETRIAPGDRTPVHTHRWPASFYVVTWSDCLICDPEGNVMADTRAMTAAPGPGIAMWTPPVPAHTVRNVGRDELLIIATELKGAP